MFSEPLWLRCHFQENLFLCSFIESSLKETLVSIGDSRGFFGDVVRTFAYILRQSRRASFFASTTISFCGILSAQSQRSSGRLLTVFSTSSVAGVLFMATAPQAIPSWIRSPSASGQVAGGSATSHGIIFCDHPAQPSSSQSERRPSAITADESTAYNGLSKARRDRGSHHDRYNHPVRFSRVSLSATNDASKVPPALAVRTTRSPTPTH